MQNTLFPDCLQANSWQDTTNPPSVTSPPGPPGSVHSDTSNWFGGTPCHHFIPTAVCFDYHPLSSFFTIPSSLNQTAKQGCAHIS